MSDYPITHNSSASRFELELEGQLAVLNYTLRDGLILFTHTGVPPALEGRGIGSALVKAGLEYARAQNRKVISYCWFVSGYIERHPEVQDLLNPPWPERPGGSDAAKLR